MKTFDEIREGYVSMAQQRAVWATRKDGGKGHPDNKRKKKKSKKEDMDETWQTISRGPGFKIQKDTNTGQKRKVADVREQDSDAVKAFLAKGGKIKKLPPAKAQGYHGRDDPGKDMHGVMDRPDTKRMGTRKKVKSMGEVTMPPKKEIMKHIGDTKHAGQAREILKKKYGVSDKHADKMINHSMGQSEAMMPEMSEGVPSYMAGRNIKKMTKYPGQDTGKPREGMMSTSKGPFGINPSGIGVKVLQKGKEVKPTPPKIGVVSYTGGKKDKPSEDVIIRSKKPTSTLRRSAASRPAGVRDGVNEISKGMAGRYLKKVPASAADAGRKSAGTTGIGPDDQKKNVEKGIRKFVNRQRGTSLAVDKMTGKAKVPAKEAKETDPPFDDAKKISTTPSKDQFGNIIKNRAKHLARKAARQAGGDMGDKKKKESVNELDQKTMNSYFGKAQRSKDRATNSAVATILRKGDHSKDLQTINKREKGMGLAKSRTIKKIRGEK